MSQTHPLTTTTFKLPGYRVTQSHGVVRGIVVRSRSIIGNRVAGIQRNFGGNIALVLGLTLLAFGARASDTNTALAVLQDYGTRCDFGEQITRGTNNAEIATNIFALFKRLTDPGNSERGDEQRQALTELLFVEDAVLVPLREVATGTNVINLAARTYLWFVGDKSDIGAMEAKLARNPREILLAPGLTRKDLADGLRAVRESLKLPADHFCTTGLTFNRRMTKAYVRVIVGSGAFNCVGWGLMFHLGDAGWELVWSRYEWVS